MLHGTPPNPLRRTADRTRTRWLVVLALSTLVAAFCGVAVGLAVWNVDSRTAREEAEHAHRITATTLGAAEHAPDSWSGGAAASVAQAAWQFPSATRHTGLVPVQPKTPAGSPVLIWVDDSGRTDKGPPSAGERAFAAMTVGATAAALLALTAASVVHLRLRTVEARSLSIWERDWRRVEPGWSGRLPTQSGVDDE
ncbi:Rv1733c family protein [Streptomyces sp. NPDC003952]